MLWSVAYSEIAIPICSSGADHASFFKNTTVALTLTNPLNKKRGRKVRPRSIKNILTNCEIRLSTGSRSSICVSSRVNAWCGNSLSRWLYRMLPMKYSHGFYAWPVGRWMMMVLIYHLKYFANLDWLGNTKGLTASESIFCFLSSQLLKPIMQPQ